MGRSSALGSRGCDRGSSRECRKESNEDGVRLRRPCARRVCRAMRCCGLRELTLARSREGALLGRMLSVDVGGEAGLKVGEGGGGLV